MRECVLFIISPPGPYGSCPEEEERSAESEEARRVAEVRVQKINKFQGQKIFPCDKISLYLFPIYRTVEATWNLNFTVVCFVRCVETLLGQDQRICNSLEEKLQLYAELTELTLCSTPVPHRHLLVQPDTDAEVPRQASTLLTAALREGEPHGPDRVTCQLVTSVDVCLDSVQMSVHQPIFCICTWKHWLYVCKTVGGDGNVCAGRGGS